MTTLPAVLHLLRVLSSINEKSGLPLKFYFSFKIYRATDRYPLAHSKESAKGSSISRRTYQKALSFQPRNTLLESKQASKRCLLDSSTVPRRILISSEEFRCLCRRSKCMSLYQQRLSISSFAFMPSSLFHLITPSRGFPVYRTSSPPNRPSVSIGALGWQDLL